MTYAIIGCGRISPNHIKAAQNNKLIIVGLCDIKEDLAREKKTSLLGDLNVNIYTNYKEMIEKEKPKLVAICTESGNHAQIAIDVINAGCNVIIEKPIALSLKDADKIIEASEKNNVKVCACHQNRFNKSIQKIRSAVEENKFGKLFYGTAHIRWNRGKEYYMQAPWRGTWEQDGGALMNQCIHNIDILRWMLGGEISEVYAYTDNLSHDYIEAEDLGIALVKFKNGSYGIIEGTTNIYPKNLEETLYLFGETGTVKAGGSSVNKLEVWKFKNEEKDEARILKEYSEVHENIYGLGHTPLYKDMINAIENNKAPAVDAYEGRKAIELVLAIYESASKNKKIKFPIDDLDTKNYNGRFNF